MSKSQDNTDLNGRLIAFAILTGMILAFYLIHLYLMQVIEIELYSNRADRVSRRTEVIHSNRGLIYDRNLDFPIAANYDVFVLYLNPEDAGPQEQIDSTLDSLSALLEVRADDLKKKVPSKLRFLKPVALHDGVNFSTITAIAERYEDFPGISWETRSIRSYTQGANFAHVLGFIGEITPAELQVLYNRGYDSDSVIGKDGIEKMYDNYLKGEDGLRMKRVDARGRRISGDDEILRAPELGKNIVLTVDRKIQDLAVKSLGNRIGSVVVMKPYNGEILALVSYPSYDPNRFYSEQAGSIFSNLSRNSSGPFVNRAIQSADSPASTFKTVLDAAIRDTKLFNPNKTVLCTGSVKIGNRVFNCHLKTGHGYVDLAEALAESCNVYFYTVGSESLDVDVIVDYAERFGFGSYTGVDLPGEISGLVPNPAWKQDVYKTKWVGGDTVNLSIGQGYLQVTPIQLASMVSLIVNNGVAYQPHLMKEVRDPITARVIYKTEPQILKTSPFNEETLEQVRKDLRGVIINGTAAPVITSKIVEIAGKTGTAQTSRGEERKHSWFISYGPYNYERLEDVVVVVVWVDGVNEWEWWAPKAANLIFHGIFADMTFEETVKDLQPLWYLQPNAIDTITGIAQ